MARVNKAANLPEDRGNKPYVLGFKAGLATGIKVLRSLITYITTYRANIVVREGSSRVKSKFYYFLAYYFPFPRLN